MTDDQLTFEPARTAVALIEYQNDFTSPGGVLHDAVAPVMRRPECLRTQCPSWIAHAASVTIMLRLPDVLPPDGVHRGGRAVGRLEL